MIARFEMVQRPVSTADFARPSPSRIAGFVLGAVGLVLIVVTLVANVVAASDVGAGSSTRETLAWSFGLTTAGFGVIKFGIATILMGVLTRAWMNVDAATSALPRLKVDAEPEADPRYGDIDTPSGKAVATAEAPPPLPMHRIAPRLWAPMLVMGVVLLLLGLILSFVQFGTDDTADFRTISAWTQGLQFLGDALLLAGISFLLGSILGALRGGGGELQEALGLTVKTLKMPLSAMAFLVLMAAGVMVSIAQLVLYIIAAYADDPTAWFAWLGTLRELGLGLLLLGIVMALYTIGTVLGAQFNRMREIVMTGR